MTPFFLFLSALLTAFILISTQSAFAEVPLAASNNDYVVLLHGMDRTALSMKPVEIYLKQRGYHVINLNYPSRRLTVEQIAEDYLAPLLKAKITNPNSRAHFVTHSLGGIIVRQYLATHELPNLGRVVMLGAPNHGSEIIDYLRSCPLTEKILSPAGRELGTSENDLPAKLGPVDFDCGVIAGDRSLNPFSSAFLSGPNDGKVTIESAKVSGMSDFLRLHYSHTWLMWRQATLRQTLSFLQSGHFTH